MLQEDLTIDEAAAMLNMSKTYVTELCRTQKIKNAYKIKGNVGRNGQWRIPLISINEYKPGLRGWAKAVAMRNGIASVIHPVPLEGDQKDIKKAEKIRSRFFKSEMFPLSRIGTELSIIVCQRLASIKKSKWWTRHDANGLFAAQPFLNNNDVWLELRNILEIKASEDDIIVRSRMEKLSIEEILAVLLSIGENFASDEDDSTNDSTNKDIGIFNVERGLIVGYNNALVICAPRFLVKHRKAILEIDKRAKRQSVQGWHGWMIDVSKHTQIKDFAQQFNFVIAPSALKAIKEEKGGKK